MQKKNKDKNKEPKLTPMLKQFLDIKNKHQDKLLLFRMGDFYETFFEDAKTASKILGITLTSRNKKNDDSIPLAGFPYHSLDNYLDKLIKAGLKVAICEQVEDPKQAKGIVKREIVDIITPGTILDQELIENDDNNYLSALVKSSKGKKFGLASIDISTGDFIFTETTESEIFSEISRLRPVEIICENNDTALYIKNTDFSYEPTITSYEDSFFDKSEAKKTLKEHFSTMSLEGFGGGSKPTGATAAGLALHYVKSLKTGDLKHISQLRYYSIAQYLQVDETSSRNLELLRSLRYGNKYGTLISIMNKTKTPMGSRRLTEWVMRPLIDLDKITHRQNIIDAFRCNIAFTNDLRIALDSIGDLSRILSKVGTKRVNPRDVLALSSYLKTSQQIANLLNEFDQPDILNYLNRILDYSQITDHIDKAIMENPPLVITEGNIIADNYFDELDEIRQISRDGKSWIARLESEEKTKTGIPSLKIGFNKVFGYFIEVTKTHKDKIPDYYIRKQTLVNSERYISPILKEYEAKVLGAEERLKSLEYELFTEIRDYLFNNLDVMNKYVDIIADIDSLTNLAFIAYQNSYIRPEFNDKGIIEIKDCRHPVIEKLLKDDEYIPNDVMLDEHQNRIALITGPNMAGKSTYLRQIGLNVIMAQMGSFIPAKEANLPIFDKVYTRVGASDNLAMGQSTFLVEMLETANILNTATPDSLILLDEIGRGTSTFDGLSLAWSIVEHIHNNKKLTSKTLFATHYHELTELENILPGVKNYNVSVKEWNDEMIFLRKIERGGADQSYGIQVARLAGIPKQVIKRAKQILKNLEDHELSPQGLSSKAKRQLNTSNQQLDIFDVMFEKSEEQQSIIDELKNIDINNTSPIEALQFLSDLKKKL